ncbi:TolC family protein [Spiribacter insolitus]|uniref:Protein CyaE n=1 Tax=Spiribacter insolitus TaxID=3122417 RepID=A0ABV3T532_9GAMM
MPNRSFAGSVATAGALLLTLAGCANDAGSLAPAQPDRQWAVPAELAGEVDRALTQPDPEAVGVDRAKRYGLPGLIDLAQRLDPETRLAWEQARAAAYAVDSARADYFPQIGAALVAGRSRSDITFDLPGLGSTTVDNTATSTIPSVFVEWMLFDFGERESAVAVAEKLAISENLGFNLAHQQTLLDVSRDYHALLSARTQAEAAERALENSERILSSAEARLARGVGNVVEVAQAEQALAQSRLDAVRARGDARAAYASLMATVGLPAGRGVDVSTRPMPLPEAMPERLDAVVRDALRHRPDILQAVVNLQAQRAALDGAEAAFRPKVGLVASAARNNGKLAINGSSFDIPATDTLALLTVEVPLFDGGLRESRRQAAAAEVAGAEAQLAAVRRAAEAEVVTAYEGLATALSAWESADALVAAARRTADATLSAYRQGVGSLPEVLAAQNGLLDAEQARSQARADAQIAMTVFAFETGSLNQGAM